MTDEDVKPNMRVKTSNGLGIVIALLKEGYSESNFLVEHDNWSGGHGGNSHESHTWTTKEFDRNSNRYYYYYSKDLISLNQLTFNYLIL